MRVVRRLGYVALILLLSSIAVFSAIRLSGGEVTAAAMPATATAEQREAFREKIGLNDPLPVQYVEYIARVLRGDFGESLTNGRKISAMLREAGLNSVLLGATAFAIVFVVSIPLGALAAIRRNKPSDAVITGASVLGMGVPNFWLALLLVWLFASNLGWLPTAGCCGVRQLVLPAVVLAAEGTALTVRMVRSAMLESLNQDYVRTLRAGGLSEWRVVGRHVLRNALIPIISLAGLRIGQLVGYALVVETIFGWPGLGQVLVNAILRRDYTVAQFFSLVLVAMVVLGNGLADICYGLANPRLRKVRTRSATA